MSSNPSLILQAKNLAFSYEGMIDPLFQKANFTLYQGDCVALLGRNGAGKSTLLKLLTQELTSTEGEVIRSGQLAILYQQDELSGEGNVLEALLASHGELAQQYKNINQAEATGLPDPMHYADLMGL